MASTAATVATVVAVTGRQQGVFSGAAASLALVRCGAGCGAWLGGTDTEAGQ